MWHLDASNAGFLAGCSLHDAAGVQGTFQYSHSTSETSSNQSKIKHSPGGKKSNGYEKAKPQKLKRPVNSEERPHPSRTPAPSPYTLGNIYPPQLLNLFSDIPAWDTTLAAHTISWEFKKKKKNYLSLSSTSDYLSQILEGLGPRKSCVYKPSLVI